MRKGEFIDITGQKFGHLTAICFDSVRGRREYFWKCRCDCGKEVHARGTHLRGAKTFSCGCVHGIQISHPVTHEQLKKLLRYDNRTGEWFWRVVTRKSLVGDRAGCINTSTGYYQLSLDKQLYGGHVLAWFYVTGIWPVREIDHKNRQRADNRWNNLREADHIQNCVNAPKKKNNTSGYKGVHKTKAGKFRAYFRRKHIGIFSDAETAAAARDAVAAKQFGEFASLNLETRT